MVRSRKRKKSLAQKIATGECIQCEHKADGDRGLCAYHTGQFKYAKNKAAEGLKVAAKIAAAKELFDDEQVKAGRILPSRKGKHSKRTENPFIQTA